MDAELKKKWVDALRSGEFKQGRRKLKSYQSYCCLGVLCEVAGLKIEPEYGNGVVGAPTGKDDYSPIYDLLGGSPFAEELWNRNDGLRGQHTAHTFSQIADYIEAHL